MEHHLIDDSNLELLIRPATIDDTLAITRLSTSDLLLSEEALDAARTIVAERLAVESGDDYFTIVAEHKTTHEIAGWLSGGGCRGQELKGWGELYALSTSGEASTLTDEALLGVAIAALHLAQFCGVTTWVDAADTMRCELFSDLGFRTDVLTTDAPMQPVEQLVRYSLEFRR